MKRHSLFLLPTLAAPALAGLAALAQPPTSETRPTAPTKKTALSATTPPARAVPTQPKATGGPPTKPGNLNLKVVRPHTPIRVFITVRPDLKEKPLFWTQPQNRNQSLFLNAPQVLLPTPQNHAPNVYHPLLTPEIMARTQSRNLLLTPEDMARVKVQFAQEGTATATPLDTARVVLQTVSPTPEKK